jgi:hypothetical protein
LQKPVQLNQNQQHQISSQQKAFEQQKRQRVEGEQARFQLNFLQKQREKQLAEYTLALENKKSQKPVREQQLEKTDNARSGAIKKQRLEKGSDDGIDEPRSQEPQWLENNKYSSKAIRNAKRQTTLKDQGMSLQKSTQSNERAKTYGTTQPKNVTSRTRTEAVPNRKYNSEPAVIRPQKMSSQRYARSTSSSRKNGPGEIIDLTRDISPDSKVEREEGGMVESAHSGASPTQVTEVQAEQVNIHPALPIEPSNLGPARKIAIMEDYNMAKDMLVVAGGFLCTYEKMKLFHVMSQCASALRGY